jgi:AhpD family alkylhydroperoxidase
MALSIGITTRCEGCVACNTKMVHQHGATRQEVFEPSRWLFTGAASARHRWPAPAPCFSAMPGGAC